MALLTPVLVLRAAAIAGAIGFLSAPAAAEGLGPADPARYDLQFSAEGILRIDRATGEIALCGADDATTLWSCRVVVAPPSNTEPAAGRAADDRRDDIARRRAEAEERAAERRRAARERSGPQRSANAELAERERAAAIGEGERADRQELARLRAETARLEARVTVLEARLRRIAALAGSDLGDVAGDEQLGSAIEDIDKAVRIGAYALDRFRDLAEMLRDGTEAPAAR